MALARHDPHVELVSVDSMQVYRGMDIGTAKPTMAERREVPHHLLDLVDPWEDFSVSEFQTAAFAALADIEARGRRPVLVGGTGLHLRAVVDALEIPGQFPEVSAGLSNLPTSDLHAELVRLDPIAAARMEPTNRRRVMRALEVTLGAGRPFSSFGPGLDSYPETTFRMVGVRWPREATDARIAGRYRDQMEAGFLDEVRSLADHPRGLGRTASQALGYRQLLRHLVGACSLSEALDAARAATRRFARRQERWFRRDPRITWVDVHDNPMEAWTQVMGDYEACI